jgi:hypothetical protein
MITVVDRWDEKAGLRRDAIGPRVIVPKPSVGGVVLDSAGNIYGTTEVGGLGYGVVFKIIQ